MPTIPLIIDTDAGTDDLMAIAYLLGEPEVGLEAITVVHGLAHVPQGARNLRRLLLVAGRPDIPVFEGEEKPLRGSREFPPSWRKLTDDLPGVRLPGLTQGPSQMGAVEFLRRRFCDQTKPVRVLALGPLTNLALALISPESCETVRDIVIMGGAVQVPGNLMDGNAESAANDVAEWNIYCDPEAAGAIIAAPMAKLLVPLDATNHVPIDRAFVTQFHSMTLSALGRVVVDVLDATLSFIDTGMYFAWDPLAAIALIDPSIVETRRARLQVILEGPAIGRTQLLRWDDTSDLKVAVAADAKRFEALFRSRFSQPEIAG